MKRIMLVMLLMSGSVAWAGNKDLLASLPPDPGEAGKATLEGIDSDNDGVRDDVQRWIAISYPNSQKTREALRQQAIALQKFLVDSADPNLSFGNAISNNDAVTCLAYIRDDFYNISDELLAVFLNTAQRSRAYLQADAHLSGRGFRSQSDRKKSCSFDPDVLSN